MCVCVCVGGGGGGAYALVLCACVCSCVCIHRGQRMGMLPHTGDEVIIVLSVFSSLYNCCSKVFIVNNTSYGATNYSRRPVNAQRFHPSSPQCVLKLCTCTCALGDGSCT